MSLGNYNITLQFCANLQTEYELGLTHVSLGQCHGLL